MKTLSRSSLLNILEYEIVRNEYRKDIIAYKKNRRISLGPHVTLTFENFRTLSFQIQEIMRAERLVHEKQIQEEVRIYNSIMPPNNGLSATLFIEITDENGLTGIGSCAPMNDSKDNYKHYFIKYPLIIISQR